MPFYLRPNSRIEGIYSTDIIQTVDDNDDDKVDYNDESSINEFIPEEGSLQYMYAWQVTIDKNARSFKNNIECGKIKSVIKPPLRWIKYENSDNFVFPVDTIKPKVQKIISTAQETPREVAVERMLRAYSKYNIEQFISKANIQIWKMVPISFIRSNNIFSDVNYKLSSFPLEWFDDTTFDCKTTEEWISFGIVDGVKYAVPAVAFLRNPEAEDTSDLNNVYHWSTVAVQSYDSIADIWKITEIKSNISYHIPRIYFCFKAENPNMYVQRIQSAIALRERCEKEMLYMLIIENMLLNNTPDLDFKKILKIFKLTFRTRSLQELTDNVKLDALTYIQMSYKNAICAIDIQNKFKNHEDFSSLPEYFKQQLSNSDNVQEARNCNSISNANRQIIIKQIIIYTIPETARAMLLVQTECLKVEEMHLFLYSFASTITLEDYCEIQNKKITTIINYLQGFWIKNIADLLRYTLRDVKGAFDINIDKWSTFLAVKMNKFLILVQQRMQCALRYLILNSSYRYTKFLTTPCKCLLHVQDDYVWDTVLNESPFQPKYNHIFVLVLQMNEAEPYYHTNPNLFLPKLLNFYDEAIRNTHYIHLIDPAVDTNLVYAKDLFLSSVGLIEDVIDEQRQKIIFSYERAIIPLKAYAERFRVYVEFYNLNITDEIAKIVSENRSSQEIKELISLEIKSQRSLEKNLPATLQIGPFLVVVDDLKQFLIKKHIDMKIKLLQMFANRLTEATEEINDSYGEIYKRLNEFPKSIEHIFELSQWIEELPVIIQGNDDIMRMRLFEYDILDFFRFSLLDPEFKVKWNAFAWPHTIFQQINKSLELYKEESKKFEMQQKFDITSFDERIETLNNYVSTLSMNYDLANAHTMSIDVIKAWKLIIDLQEYGETLNKRQILLELAPIDLSAIGNLKDSFEPYKSMWTTIADFRKSRESWHENPFNTVELVVLKENYYQFHKDIAYCVSVFEEMPKALDIAIACSKEIEDFHPTLELIESLKNPDWLPTHWRNLSKDTGVEFKYTQSMNLGYLVRKNILNYKDIVFKVSELATAEKELLKAAEEEALRLQRIEENLALMKRKRREARPDLF